MAKGKEISVRHAVTVCYGFQPTVCQKLLYYTLYFEFVLVKEEKNPNYEFHLATHAKQVNRNPHDNFTNFHICIFM